MITIEIDMNYVSRRMVIGDKGHDVFTQVRALSMEVKPYFLLD